MPELPEVESVRQLLGRCAVGQSIVRVRISEDPIVFESANWQSLTDGLLGASVESVGRKGKVAWLALDTEEHLFFHLGMSGWVREAGSGNQRRLVSHGAAPLEDPAGEPRFWKLQLELANGSNVVWTDARRFSRIWLSGNPSEEPRVVKLGPDAFCDPLPPAELCVRMGSRKPPLKTLLLDQSIISGIGNWVADEVLLRARLSPFRTASTMSGPDWESLGDAIGHVLHTAVGCGAEAALFPQDWLFHIRWRLRLPACTDHGCRIVRESVGGRSTVWIPELQH